MKIVGVHAGRQLVFAINLHIAGLCKNAGRHMNALSRMSKSYVMAMKLALMQTFMLSHSNFVRRCDIL